MENYLTLPTDSNSHTAEDEKYEYVTVALKYDPYGKEKPFRCLRCGGLIFKHYNNIRIILEGKVLPEENLRPLDIMCTHRCKTIYRII